MSFAIECRTKILVLIVLLSSSWSIAQSEFKLCNDSTRTPYYYPGISFPGGTWKLKKIFNEDWPVIKKEHRGINNGLVVIHFDINCWGETGNFEVKTYNSNYELKKINKKITDNLLSKFEALKGWIPGKNEKDEFINSHSFLAFKIKNGNLIEILPK